MCKRNTELQRMINIIDEIRELDDLQKHALKDRFVKLLNEFSSRCRYYSILFHMGHVIITVGSLIVPALLSIQYADTGVNFISTKDYQAQIYWLTWIISLLVTTFNGILVLFKVDKKYYFLHTMRERLRSEGWQYIQLTGRYAGSLIHYSEPVSHKNQFKYFCHHIEKMRMKQIEEEYYKHDESNQHQNISGGNTTSTNTGGDKNSIHPPSLSEPIAKIAENNVPGQIKQAMNSIVILAEDSSDNHVPISVGPSVSELSDSNTISNKTEVELAPSKLKQPSKIQK